MQELRGNYANNFTFDVFLVSDFWIFTYTVWRKNSCFFLRLEWRDTSFKQNQINKNLPKETQQDKTEQRKQTKPHKTKKIVFNSVSLIILLIVMFCQHICRATKYNIHCNIKWNMHTWSYTLGLSVVKSTASMHNLVRFQFSGGLFLNLVLLGNLGLQRIL